MAAPLRGRLVLAAVAGALATGCGVALLAVSGFIATRNSLSFRRQMYPSFEARIANQDGRPALLEGNRFFPDTGIPIWKMALNRTVFAVWLPEPFTVAT